MDKKTQKRVIIIGAVVLLLGAIVSFSLINSNAVDIKPEIKSNESGHSNTSVNITNQTTTNTTKNTFSIPLEKPPFIKD